MSEVQISRWEKEREKGRFSYILKETIILTPFIIFFSIIVHYFFDDLPIDSKKVLFEIIFTGFSIAFILSVVKLYQLESSYKKSVLQNKKNS